MLGKQEQTIFTTAGVIAVGLLAFTAKLGASLVFDHAAGIDNHVLQDQIESRPGHMHNESQPPHADSAAAARDSADHRH